MYKTKVIKAKSSHTLAKRYEDWIKENTRITLINIMNLDKEVIIITYIENQYEL